MRVYLDTAILIYLVEDVPPFCAAASARLASPEIEKVTSELARLEVLVMPLRNGDEKLAAAFQRYIDTACSESWALSRAVMENRGGPARAARLSQDARCHPSRGGPAK